MAGETEVFALAILLVVSVNAFLYYRLKDLREQFTDKRHDTHVNRVKDYVSNFSWYDDEGNGSPKAGGSPSSPGAASRFSSEISNSLQELKSIAGNEVTSIHNRLSFARANLSGDRMSETQPIVVSGEAQASEKTGDTAVQFFPENQ